MGFGFWEAVQKLLLHSQDVALKAAWAIFMHIWKSSKCCPVPPLEAPAAAGYDCLNLGKTLNNFCIGAEKASELLPLALLANSFPEAGTAFKRMQLLQMQWPQEVAQDRTPSRLWPDILSSIPA